MCNYVCYLPAADGFLLISRLFHGQLYDLHEVDKTTEWCDLLFFLFKRSDNIHEYLATMNYSSRDN